jgi:hypothetical protein
MSGVPSGLVSCALGASAAAGALCASAAYGIRQIAATDAANQAFLIIALPLVTPICVGVIIEMEYCHNELSSILIFSRYYLVFANVSDCLSAWFAAQSRTAFADRPMCQFHACWSESA